MSQSEEGFPKLEITRKTGSELFHQSGLPVGFTLLNFWQWFASDLVGNTMRGVLAEYIVAHALGIAGGTRIEWDAFDLVTKSGLRVEVKSAAYLQSWYHKKLSAINFSIRPAKRWDAETNELSKELKRQADVYVFCLLNHKEKSSLDPLNLDQWEFYLLPASVFDEKYLQQKSIGLASLLKLNPCMTKYEGIAKCVEELSLAKRGEI